MMSYINTGSPPSDLIKYSNQNVKEVICHGFHYILSCLKLTLTEEFSFRPDAGCDVQMFDM